MTTKPDFNEWSVKLIDSEGAIDADDVETALSQAYEQGYQYGLNNGWAEEIDKEADAIIERLASTVYSDEEKEYKLDQENQLRYAFNGEE